MKSLVLSAALLGAAAQAQQQPPPAPATRQEQQRAATTTPEARGAVTAPRRVLSFQDTLQLAEKQNLDLQVARARLDQTRQLTWKAWSNYLPQLSVGASATRNNTAAVIPFVTEWYVRDVREPQGPPMGVPPDYSPENPPGLATPYILFPKTITEVAVQKRDQFGAQAQLNQTILAPSLIASIAASHAGVEVAELNVENARREVLFGAAQLYFGAAGLKQALSVQERLLEVQVAREKDAQVRFDAGAQPKVALLRAQIDRARAEQDVQRARNSYESARIALATLLDEPADFDVVVPEEPVLPAGLEQLEQQALTDRPDVKAAFANVGLAERQRTAAWLKFLPNVGLSAVYRRANVGGFTGDPTSWAVTLGLNWTLLDGGLREAELREAGARVAEARASERAAQNRARDEVRRGLLELESTRANRVKAQEQLQLARENQRLVDASFKAGAATYLEVADANAALFAAETGAVGETLNASLAALRVLKAAGQFAAPTAAK